MEVCAGLYSLERIIIFKNRNLEEGEFIGGMFMNWNLRLSRIAVWGGAIVLFALAAAFLVSILIEGPLRRHMENEMNRSLKGYTVRLPDLDFHPIGLSVTLKDLTVLQQAHPDPPVAHFPVLHASLHWRAILAGRLVAEFELERPRIYINLAQLRAEAASEVPVEERGWQGAVQAIYPLKVNLLTIRDADLVYIDQDPKRPLHLSQLFLKANNIRNIYSPERTYPSPFRLEGNVFGTGRMAVKGNANFLAEPHPGIDAYLDLEETPLDYFRPILARYNFQISDGLLSASGKIEYAPQIKIAHLRTLTANKVKLDYIHSAKTAPQEKRRAEETREAAREVSNKPGVLLRIDDLRLTGDLGMVNQAADPSYRLFFNRMDFHLTNLSNHFSEGEARAKLNGYFMGSGNTSATAAFRPETDGPDFDLAVKIVGTKLPAMNDLLRAYGNFDVVAGSFSPLYSEIRVKNDTIDGYVKPLFKDVDVYDRRQDEEKNLFRKVYEGLVGGVAELLENQPREQVATQADLSGEVEDPQASTWQIVVRLIQNAFVKAILPGFEREASG